MSHRSSIPATSSSNSRPIIRVHECHNGSNKSSSSATNASSSRSRSATSSTTLLSASSSDQSSWCRRKSSPAIPALFVPTSTTTSNYGSSSNRGSSSSVSRGVTEGFVASRRRLSSPPGLLERTLAFPCNSTTPISTLNTSSSSETFASPNICINMVNAPADSTLQCDCGHINCPLCNLMLNLELTDPALLH